MKLVESREATYDLTALGCFLCGILVLIVGTSIVASKDFNHSLSRACVYFIYRIVASDTKFVPSSQKKIESKIKVETRLVPQRWILGIGRVEYGYRFGFRSKPPAVSILRGGTFVLLLWQSRAKGCFRLGSWPPKKNLAPRFVWRMQVLLHDCNVKSWTRASMKMSSFN